MATELSMFTCWIFFLHILLMALLLRSICEKSHIIYIGNYIFTTNTMV